MEQLQTDSGTGVPPVWSEIAPHLDAALEELDDTDRDALLLRYFKNHDLRTVGATLGISDDAAQKRVSRAVKRLREFFAKRGLTVGASGLAVVISANAVQAAPVGLALTISTAAVMTGTTLVTTATAIAMTALQKTIVAATIAVLTGAGIYEARQAVQLREQVQMLQQQQAPLAEQIQQLERERDEITNRLALIREDNQRLNHNTGELLKLRAEITQARNQLAELLVTKSNNANAEKIIVASSGILVLNDQLLKFKERMEGSQTKVEQMIKDLNLPNDAVTNIYNLAERGDDTDELYVPVVDAIRELNEERRYATVLEGKLEIEKSKVKGGTPK